MRHGVDPRNTKGIILENNLKELDLESNKRNEHFSRGTTEESKFLFN